MVVFGIVAVPVLADPQILHYVNGYWFNDRNEEVNPAIITEYNEISSNPWVIEVISPELHYADEVKQYDNGESIIIMQGATTITLTADTTVTLTIQN